MIHTGVKAKITKRLGARWTLGWIARRAGVTISAVSKELCCTGDGDCRARHTPGVQDAISKVVGVPTGKLFGRHAWFRLAAKQLQRMRRTA